MKKSVIAFILLSSITFPAHAAETVACVDSSGDWKVNFTLDGKFVSELKFNFRDQLMAAFPMMTAQVTHFFKKYHYELKFDQASYFSFDRIKNRPSFAGSFLLTQDPIGLETNVICNAN